MDVFELLSYAINQNASDLHLSAGLPPLIRTDGNLHRINDTIHNHNTISSLVAKILPSKFRNLNLGYQEIDFALEQPGLPRCRVNVFSHRRGLSAAFRILPTTIPSLAQLRLPESILKVANLAQGLVLITGPSGSGKSTTLAAIIDYINSNKACHILTIEDPIEFVHESKNCLINQREVNQHSENFHTALRSALRQDPDIILIGELRDLETIRLALSAAETGHLVLATLHTRSTTSTINRIIDVFPSGEKNLIRALLADSLQAVIAQRLLPCQTGGRIANVEIMINTPAIRHLIREHKLTQIYTQIQTNKAAGMQTFEQHAQMLLMQHLITPATANH